jgi:hypothetical protein
MEIRAVSIGQDDLKKELKTDMKSGQDKLKNGIENSICDNMSALETRIKARHEELRQEICLSGNNKEYRGRPYRIRRKGDA